MQQRLIESKIELRLDRALGRRDRPRGPTCEALGERRCLGEGAVLRDEALVKPDFVGPLGIDEVAGHEELGGIPEPDEARKEPRRPHVRAGKPDADEQKGDLGGFGRDPDVARRGDHGAGARDGAVQGGDDRPPAPANVQDEVAGHPRESPKAGRVVREERTDDVFDVSPRAEGAARAGQHDRPHVRLRIQRVKRVPQLGVDLEGQGVQPLGPVERDGRDSRVGAQSAEERPGCDRHATGPPR